MQEEPAPIVRKPSQTDLDNILYWSKLSTGLLCGFLSYMIMRFSDLTFFIIIPLLLVLTILLSILIVLIYDRRHNTKMTPKKIFWKSLNYTGTYLLAFIALATLSFYWGA